MGAALGAAHYLADIHAHSVWGSTVPGDELV